MAEEGRFPGDRSPRRGDNQDASAPLDPTLLRSFKMSLPSSGRGSHFYHTAAQDQPVHQRMNGLTSQGSKGQAPTNNGNLASNRAREDPAQPQDLLYPVSLFSAFPELPSTEILSKLLDNYSRRFLPHTPFLAGLDIISTSEFQRDKTAPYLVFAMAVLGALVSSERDLIFWGPSLWKAASHIHSVSCEIDNRSARKVDWVTSVRLSLGRRCIPGAADRVLVYLPRSIWNHAR